MNFVINKKWLVVAMVSSAFSVLAQTESPDQADLVALQDTAQHNVVAIGYGSEPQKKCHRFCSFC